MTRAAGVDTTIEFRCEGEPFDTGSQPVELALDQALLAALQHAPAVQIAIAQVRIAAADADQARRFANPILSLVVRWGPGKPAFEASLTESIVQVLQTRRRASAADHRLRSASAAAVATTLDVVVDLQRRYLAAQHADQRLALLTQHAATTQQLLVLAASRVRHGEGAAAELTAAEAAVAAAELALHEQRRARAESRLQLAHAIGAPSGTTDWRLQPWPAATAEQSSEAAWIERGLQQHPELLAQRWQLAALDDDLALADWWPWQGSTVGAETQRTPDWYTGPNLSVPLPLFDGGGAAIDRATAERIAARHELTRAGRAVIEAIRTAHAELQGRRASLDHLQRQLLPARRRLEQAAASAARHGLGDALAPLQIAAARQQDELLQLDLELGLHQAALTRWRAAGGADAPTTTPASNPNSTSR